MELPFFSRKIGKLVVVALLGHLVGGCQVDVARFFAWVKVWLVTVVPAFDILGSECVGAKIFEQVDKALFLLSVNTLELDDVWFDVAHHVGGEEVRRGVVGFESVGFFACDNGWELVQVADENHLDAAEWFAWASAVES